MLPYIYRELILRRKWFTDKEIVDIFTVSQSIPGAISVNAAFDAGFRKAGIPGGLFSAAGIVLPAFFAIVFLLLFFFEIRDTTWARKFLAGVITASAALILLTTIEIAKTVCKKEILLRAAIALIVFIAVGAFNVNALWMILAGIFFGLTYHVLKPKTTESNQNHAE